MASDTAAFLPALDWQWPRQCEEASRHCNVSCSCSSVPVLVSFTLPGCVRFVDISYRKKGDKDFLTAVKPFYERASEQVGCCVWPLGLGYCIITLCSFPSATGEGAERGV